MKKLIFLFVLLLTNTSSYLAQECYTVKMNMKIEGMPPEYAGYGEQDMVMYIKGDKYKNEISSMMGSSTTSFDGKAFISISDQMGNKTGYTATQTELDSMRKKGPNDKKPNVEYIQEKKVIAGYECSKAIITNTINGKEQKTTVWTTDKIKSNAAKGRRTGGRGMQMDFGDLKGYPLQIEMAQNQNGVDMKMMMTTTEVLTSALDDSVFIINTEGYNMSSYKEMVEQMKAMKKNGQ